MCLLCLWLCLTIALRGKERDESGEGEEKRGRGTERGTSLKSVWFGTLFGASFPGPPAVSAAICDGLAAIRAVLGGAERLSGGPRGAEPPS